jgi:preprotein translocase subunit SecB|tara:strand:+ start:3760 stop:4197 length:438 start_codon:yes stop_codon:yes gene_type:complete
MDVKTKIITQFIKDLSFENPNGPMAFNSQAERPEVNANIDVKATNKKDTNIYEIELNVNVTAKKGDQKIYLVDLRYVGIFEIENLTDDIKEAYLLVECPRQLFPFARRIVYDLHADGSIPPLLLDPVNFAQLYQQKKEVKEKSIN